MQAGSESPLRLTFIMVHLTFSLDHSDSMRWTTAFRNVRVAIVSTSISCHHIASISSDIVDDAHVVDTGLHFDRKMTLWNGEGPA
jgi:hypothetical protein